MLMHISISISLDIDIDIYDVHSVDTAMDDSNIGHLYRCPVWQHGYWGSCGNVCISDAQGISFFVAL